jgi:mannose-6-phosphate isomerase-like protein (cupin superfamily)
MPTHESISRQHIQGRSALGRDGHRQHGRDQHGLHWTDAPYTWHVNDGDEVFAVLSGRLEMRCRDAGLERSVMLDPGDVFYADVGPEHQAHPIGEARILVVEREDSA